MSKLRVFRSKITRSSNHPMNLIFYLSCFEWLETLSIHSISIMLTRYTYNFLNIFGLSNIVFVYTSSNWVDVEYAMICFLVNMFRPTWLLSICIFFALLYSWMIAFVLFNSVSYVPIPNVDELEVSICVIVVHIFISLVWISSLPELLWLWGTLLFGCPLLNWIDFSVIMAYFIHGLCFPHISLFRLTLVPRVQCCWRNWVESWFTIVFTCANFFRSFLDHTHFQVNQDFWVSKILWKLNTFECNLYALL